MNRKPHVLTSIPEYEGAAVYALTDSAGKSYIGSTNNLRLRLRSWETFMRLTLLDREGKCYNLPYSLDRALRSGLSFRAEVIEALPADMPHSERCEHEKRAILARGGLAATYNSMIPSWKGK